MAFTRKFLSALGIEDEKVDEIINAHTEVVNGLKEDRDSWKAKAEESQDAGERLKEVQKELSDLKEGADPFEEKYNDLKNEYDKYKNEQEEKALTARKSEAYRGLLKDAGIAEKRIDTILKASPSAIQKIDFEEDGNVKDAKDIVGKLKEEWADFIVQSETKGSNPATPPTNTGGGGMSKEEIMAIKDGAARRKAIAENIQLFDNTAVKEGE